MGIVVVKLIELTVAKETSVEGVGGDFVDLGCEGFSLARWQDRHDVGMPMLCAVRSTK